MTQIPLLVTMIDEMCFQPNPESDFESDYCEGKKLDEILQRKNPGGEFADVEMIG